jgi:hypothetical protein
MGVDAADPICGGLQQRAAPGALKAGRLGPLPRGNLVADRVNEIGCEGDILGVPVTRDDIDRADETGVHVVPIERERKQRARRGRPR